MDAADPLNEHISLSLADKAHLGLEFGCDEDDAASEHLQWELRMALERIHSNAGNSAPILGTSPTFGVATDGMDAVSSAMLLELASDMMPKGSPERGIKKYTRDERKVAIKRCLPTTTHSPVTHGRFLPGGWRSDPDG